MEQNKELAGKIRIISISIRCKHEEAFPQHEGIEHYWMNSSTIKKLREAIPDVDTGIYYYLIGDSSGKIISAGNPQEVILKDEVNKVVQINDKVEEKKELGEITEEEEEFDEEDEYKESIEPMQDIASARKYMKTVKVSFEDAKKELIEFVNKNIKNIQEIQKIAKSFEISLRDEYISKFKAEEWIHLGTSTQMLIPITEKHLPDIKPFVDTFEKHFEAMLTVYSSGPIYGSSPSFAFGNSCSACHCALGLVAQFLCIKCNDYSLCLKCYKEHQHFLYYVMPDSKVIADEIVPRCKKTIRKVAMKSCTGCKTNAKTMRFICGVCSSLTLCKDCFGKVIGLKDEAIIKECVKVCPHHDFNTHLYITVPPN